MNLRQYLCVCDVLAVPGQQVLYSVVGDHGEIRWPGGQRARRPAAGYGQGPLGLMANMIAPIKPRSRGGFAALAVTTFIGHW
jgi:hypothetical protein